MNEAPGSYRSCNLCGAVQPTLVYSKAGYSIVECRQCSLVYVGEDPASMDFSQLYGEAYYTGGNEQVFANYIGEERARRASARRRLWGLRRLAPGGRLLDVGCAAGFFLAEAQRYYDVKGVELSEYSSRYGREQLGLDVVTGTLQEAALPSESFDMITLWDVIEHVADPSAVLRESARLLKPGGHLVLTTGDIGSHHARMTGVDWPLMEPPWHLYYFSRDTMAKMGERAGLQYVSCRTRGVYSSHRLLNNRYAAVFANLVGLGDIMQMHFRK
jgi:SAM-dependent methyltransferase